jgi:hypothetical protein
MPRIIGTGNYCEAVDGDVPDLKSLLKETLGTSVRRIDRFIQAALIGAARCVQSARSSSGEVLTLPPETAVYLSSGRGDMEITVEVQRDLFVNAHPPKPLNFINTVSNAASFYIAQSFKLRGRNQFIANTHWAFEVALQTALLDLRMGKVQSALVGSVDVIVAPNDSHRRRLGLAADTPLAEASHWLWLDHSKLDHSRLDARAQGVVEILLNFPDRAALLDGLASIRSRYANIHLSAGQFLAADDFYAIRATLPDAPAFDYRTTRGFYQSQSGAAIAEFLKMAERKAGAATLLHINGDALGRYLVFVTTDGAT